MDGDGSLTVGSGSELFQIRQSVCSTVRRYPAIGSPSFKRVFLQACPSSHKVEELSTKLPTVLYVGTRYAVHGESTRPYSAIRTNIRTGEEWKPDSWIVFCATSSQEG